MGKLNFKEVKEVFKRKDKQGIVENDEVETEYVCTGRNKFGIGTYAIRKVGSGIKPN